MVNRTTMENAEHINWHEVQQEILDVGWVVLRGVLPLELVDDAQRSASTPAPAEDEPVIESTSVQHYLDPDRRRGLAALMQTMESMIGKLGKVIPGADSVLLRIVRWRNGASGFSTHVDMVPDQSLGWPQMDLWVSVPFTEALEPRDGALFAYPGSHRTILEHVAKQDDPEHSIWSMVDRYRMLSDLPFELGERLLVELRRGDVLLAHPALAHGVFPNESGVERSTMILNVCGARDARARIQQVAGLTTKVSPRRASSRATSR